MLLYVLLHFIAFRSQWPHSFTRLFTIVRGVAPKDVCEYGNFLRYKALDHGS